MTAEQQIVLELIRFAMDPSLSLSIDKKLDWKTVIDFSLKQGVVGICFDTFRRIKDSINPDFAPNEMEIMAWFGYTNILEKKYEHHKQAIWKLSLFYQKNDIEMMLLKGGIWIIAILAHSQSSTKW